MTEHELTAGQCEQMRADGVDPSDLAAVFRWIMEHQDERADWNRGDLDDFYFGHLASEELVSARVVTFGTVTPKRPSTR